MEREWGWPWPSSSSKGMSSLVLKRWVFPGSRSSSLAPPLAGEDIGPLFCWPWAYWHLLLDLLAWRVPLGDPLRLLFLGASSFCGDPFLALLRVCLSSPHVPAPDCINCSSNISALMRWLHEIQAFTGEWRSLSAAAGFLSYGFRFAGSRRGNECFCIFPQVSVFELFRQGGVGCYQTNAPSFNNCEFWTQHLNQNKQKKWTPSPEFYILGRWASINMQIQGIFGWHHSHHFRDSLFIPEDPTFSAHKLPLALLTTWSRASHSPDIVNVMLWGCGYILGENVDIWF